MNSKDLDTMEYIISTFSPAIPLFVGICFLISFLYNLGFYYGLNLNLSVIPISIIDITNSTIKFSIVSAIALLIGSIIRKNDTVVSTTENSGSIEDSQKIIKKNYFMNNMTFTEILIDRWKNGLFILMLLILMFFWGTRSQFIFPLMISLIWLSFKTFNINLIKLLNLVALIISVGYGWGIYIREIETTNITLKINQKITNGYLVQNLDKGVLCKIEKNILFLPWEEIESMQYLIPSLYRGYYCKKYKFC